MAAKKKTAAKKVVFEVEKMGSNVWLKISFERSPAWLFNGRFGSVKKALAGIETVKKRCVDPANFEVKFVKANPHWYFTLRGPKGENLGGCGGFETEADARKAIEHLGRVAPRAELVGKYA